MNPTTLHQVIDNVVQQRSILSVDKALLIAISGIDASGKGYITRAVSRLLAQQDLRVAVINMDGWLNLPGKRFSDFQPAWHFYHHAVRFDELFEQLVFPLRDRRSIYLKANYVEETAFEYRSHIYQYENIDVILLEGIYLLKQQFQSIYDLSIWLECSFETALKRAIDRSQEGLTPAETVAAYQTIYFPAQRIHFEQDKPQQAATCIIHNDG